MRSHASMTKYFLAVLTLVVGGLSLLTFWVGVPTIQRRELVAPAAVHVAGDPRRSIANVEVVAVYFIPRNRTPAPSAAWREPLQASLEEFAAFHHLQLHERSRLTYVIYPQPVLGLADSLSYDTTDTNNGNPAALRSIAAELEARLFDPTGDLFQPELSPARASTYRSLFILYEGVGAAGAVGEPAAILSRQFLTKAEYEGRASSLLAHEIYHTLGLSDAYTPGHGEPTSSDLMGQGRFRPLSRTYLNPEAVQRFER